MSSYFHTAAYLLTQALGVIAIIIVVRFGKGTLGVGWIAGVLLVQGWGATLFTLVTPTLSSRVWTASVIEGLKGGSKGLAVALGLAVLMFSLPRSEEWVTAASNLTAPWTMWFLAIGAFRAFAQVLSTFLVRDQRHSWMHRFQLPGRFMEGGVVVGSAYLGNPYIFAAGWAIYPIAQLAALGMHPWRLREGSKREVQQSEEQGHGRTLGERVATLCCLISDLIVPTVWMRLGGEITFLAYRAITSALSYAVLLPRYWHVVASLQKRQVSHQMTLFVVVVSLIVALISEVGTDAIPANIIGLSMIPLILNAVGANRFSSVRQDCLHRGDLLAPAAAILGGRMAELALLVVIAWMAPSMKGAEILAYSAFAVSTLVLVKVSKRGGQ